MIKLIFKEIFGIDNEVIDRVNMVVMKIAKIISVEVKELMSRKIYREGLDPKVTSSLLVGGVMMLVYEYDKKKFFMQYLIQLLKISKISWILMICRIFS